MRGVARGPAKAELVRADGGEPVELSLFDSRALAVAELLAIDPGFDIARFARCQPYRDQGVLARLTGSLRRAGIIEGAGAPPTVSELAPPSTPSRRASRPVRGGRFQEALDSRGCNP